MYWSTVVFNGGAGVEWPSVFTIIPDWFVDFYGDFRLGSAHYEAMKTWVRTMQRRVLPDGTLPATSFGDWCDASTMDGKINDHGSTPRDLISTAYQYNNCRIVARFARFAGKTDDEKAFNELAENLRTAFNRKFLDPKRGTYQGETQCGDVLALKFGLVPEDSRRTVIDHLIEDIMVKHEGHLTVGLIGMQWLMQTLTEIGHPEIAWKIATQTTRPSWGYMLANGATTIWERWDYDTRDPGMNSEDLLIQAGNLDAWFYQTLAGIDCDRVRGGFKRFSIRPHVLGDLTWAKAHFDSPYGRIKSAWKVKEKRFELDVTVPANTTATVVVPGNGGPHEVGPGTHRFVATLP
jgi:alpha-L-rhamnosidase